VGRYASIDIGSNSTLLLVVERKHLGGVRVLVDTKISTKLSFGAATGNKITAEGITRQCDAFDRIGELLKNYHVDKIVACATQVFRITENGQALAEELSQRCGWPIEIIDGDTEAKCSYLAAASGLKNIHAMRTVVDVGGGSTEIVSGRGERIDFAGSFPIGAVKLAEACSLTDLVKIGTLQSAISEIGSAIPAESLKSIPRVNCLIAVGGTAATFAALKLDRQVFDPALIHGVGLAGIWLQKAVADLSGMTTEERRKRLIFDPDRAEIIVAGGLILNYLVQELDVADIIVSNRGLRWGVLLSRFPEVAASMTKQEGGA
jgi:exopolyphosphatase / guanosine-5'-triphosphate,3'-diphosphate pyrophosphatase